MRKKAPAAKNTSSTPKASTPKPARSTGNGAPPRVSVSVSPEGIRLRAYQKWQAAGCPDGDGVCFWLEAERELLQAAD